MIRSARTLFITLVIAATALLVGCGGGSGSQDPSLSVNSDVTIIDLITTDFTNVRIEGWSCIDNAGEASVYTFYDKGMIEELENLRMGSEYLLQQDVEPFVYNWIVVDNASIILRSQVLGLQDRWTNIEFSDSDSSSRLMRAVSGSRGQLYCTIGEKTA